PNARALLPLMNLRPISAATRLGSRSWKARDSGSEHLPQLLGNHRVDCSMAARHPPLLDARPSQIKLECSLRRQDRTAEMFGACACPPFPWRLPSARASERSQVPSSASNGCGNREVECHGEWPATSL